MIKGMDEYSPSYEVTKVLWEHPPDGWVKYNTDGAAKGNPRPSSYAYCVRNSRGELLFGEGRRIEYTTNTVAEARAILEACKHIKANLYNHVIIQTDSMLLWKVLEGKWSCPWIIEDIMSTIKDSMQHIIHVYQHTLREGNKLADYIANLAIEDRHVIIHGVKEMQAEGQRIVHSDKLKSPYIRVSSLRG